MKAKLIAKTQPVDIDAKDANEFIAYVARVSNPENQHNNETAPRLINYLMRHKHWSPFEHYSLTLEIECPKDIAIQLLRHRSFTFQEFSQRYADVNAVGFVRREARLQDKANRQNSLEVDDESIEVWWRAIQNEVSDLSIDRYNRALELGIAKEQARALLPIGLTNSRLYVTGNVRSWLHYLIVRLDPTTQKEHRQLAESVKAEVQKVFDISPILKH